MGMVRLIPDRAGRVAQIFKYLMLKRKLVSSTIGGIAVCMLCSARARAHDAMSVQHIICISIVVLLLWDRMGIGYSAMGAYTYNKRCMLLEGNKAKSDLFLFVLFGWWQWWRLCSRGDWRQRCVWSQERQSEWMRVRLWLLWNKFSCFNAIPLICSENTLLYRTCARISYVLYIQRCGVYALVYAGIK